MNNWKIMKLGEILLTLESGSRPKGGVRNNSEGVPSIGGEHLNADGSFNFKNIKYISEEFYSNLKKGKIKENDILIVKDGATTGKIAFVSSSFPYEKAAVNEHVFILRAKPKIEPKYLFYFLYSKYGQKQILSTFHGAAIGGINTKFVNYVKVPLPPLPIQKRIVSILEKVEKLKERRKKANEETNKIIQSIFYEMFGDPVKNEKGFPVKKFKEFAKIKRDQFSPKDLPKENINYIGLENIESDTGRLINYSKTNRKNIKSNKFIFDKDCVLYGKLRPYLNKVLIPNFEGVCSTDIIPIKPRTNQAEKYFILYLLRSKYFVKLATEKSTGANLPRISPKTIELLEFALPPLPLQLKFASIVKKIESMKERQKKSTEDINLLFDALMQKAFKGGL